MGSIPAGNIHKGTRRAKTGRQTYVSLLTHMSVFPFLYGDANDRGSEASEVSMACSVEYRRRQPAMKEATLPNRAWLVAK